MKLIIFLGLVMYVHSDKLDRTYLPPKHAESSAGSNNILQTPNLSGSSQNFGNRNSPTNQNTFQRTNSFRNRYEPEEPNNFRELNAGNRFQAKGNNGNTPNNYGANQGFNYQSSEQDYDQINNFSGRFTPEASFDSNVAINSAANDVPAYRDINERPQASLERTATILRQDSENDGETYSYAYETENGIYAEENGIATNGVEAQGGYSYTGDDGQVYSIKYTADQNGFVPQGDHLPTPPPIPEEILRALEQNAADEAAGLFDDGRYDADKFGDQSQFGNLDLSDGHIDEYQNGKAFGFGANSNAYLPPPTRNTKADHRNAARRGVNGPLQRFPIEHIADEDRNVRQNGRYANIGTNSNAYLPPFSRSNNQGESRNQINQRYNVNNMDNPTSKYLPPRSEISNTVYVNGRNRQPTFNARSGYKY